MGAIYKRGEIWWIKYYRAGRPYRESTGSRRETDARRLLKKREGEIAEGKRPALYFDRVRFEDLAEDYLRDYRINGKRTLDKAEQIVKTRLMPYFGGMRATEITTATARAYTEKRLAEGASNATINRELAALRRMFSLAAESDPPRVPGVPKIPMLAEENVRQGFFEHEEFLRLREALPEEYRAIVTLAYRTGWRKREILDLTWDRVDLKEGTVRLEAAHTKNKQARTVYLDEECLEALRGQFKRRRIGCPYVFHRDGDAIRNFRKAWDAACRKAGLRGRIFHDFRRTAIRNMVRAGIPERVAMEISGHKTRCVFERYNIVSPSDLRRAATILGDYLRAQDGHSESATGTIWAQSTVFDIKENLKKSDVSGCSS